MAISTEKALWAARVLGILAPRHTTSSTSAKVGGQLFIKGADTHLFTIDLPLDLDVSLGELKMNIERKIGYSLDGWRLIVGTRQLSLSDDSLLLSAVGVKPGDTIQVLGRLLGGGVAEDAAHHATSLGVALGNVVEGLPGSSLEPSSIELESMMRGDFVRQLTTQGMDINKEFLNLLTEKIVTSGLVEEGTWVEFLADKAIGLLAETAIALKSGRCKELTAITYMHLLDDPQGGFVYFIAMLNSRERINHAFAVTCDEQCESIQKLLDSTTSIAIDAWFNEQICSLTDYVGGKNPYARPINLSYLSIFKSARTGSIDKPTLNLASSAIRSAAVDLFNEAYEMDSSEMKKDAIEDLADLWMKSGTKYSQVGD